MSGSRTGTRESIRVKVLGVAEAVRQGWAWERGEAGLASFLVISTRLQGLICPTECRIF